MKTVTANAKLDYFILRPRCVPHFGLLVMIGQSRHDPTWVSMPLRPLLNC